MSNLAFILVGVLVILGIAVESKQFTIQRGLRQALHHRVKRQAISQGSSAAENAHYSVSSGLSNSQSYPSGSSSLHSASTSVSSGSSHSTYNYPFGRERIHYVDNYPTETHHSEHSYVGSETSGGSVGIGVGDGSSSSSGLSGSLGGGENGEHSGGDSSTYYYHHSQQQPGGTGSQTQHIAGHIVYTLDTNPGSQQHTSYDAISGTESESGGSVSITGTDDGTVHSSGNNQGTGHSSGIGYSSGSNQGTGYSSETIYTSRTNQGTGYSSGTNQGSGYISGTVFSSGTNEETGYGSETNQGTGYGSETIYSSGTNQGTGYLSGTNQGTGYISGTNQGTGYSSGGYITGLSGRRRHRTSNQGYSNDRCPNTGVELRIDGLSCYQAIRRYGAGICYTHEYSSRQCCLNCRPRRNPARPGCEYGDRSVQCSNIRPAACYDLNNRHICCDTCRRLRRSNTPGCEYGDRSYQCQMMLRNPGLCYDNENRRMCCQTCAHLRNANRPGCEWGDHNTQRCTPFIGNSTDVRINCYSPRIRNLCCNSCQRLRDWVPDNLPSGCEYGDHPVTFLSNQVGDLRCSTYFHYFPSQHCENTGSDVARYCCHTCFRRLYHSG